MTKVIVKYRSGIYFYVDTFIYNDVPYEKLNNFSKFNIRDIFEKHPDAVITDVHFS